MTSLATADFLAKRIYKSGLDEEALTSGNQLLSHVARNKKFASNQGLIIAAQGSNGQGLGSTHAGAYAARVGVKGQNWTVPQRRMYWFGELDSDIVRNAEAGDSETQFANVLMKDVDGATENFGQEINQRLYKTNLGVRAVISAISTTLVTLENPEDTAYFAQDMLIGALDTSSSDALLTGNVTVAGVDPVLGTVTGSANWSTITGIAVGDKLIRADTRAASLDGLDAWCPADADLSTNFLGVNQTIHRQIYAGVYVNISNFAVREGFLFAAATAKRMLGRGFNKRAPWFMNPMDAMEIIASVEAVKVNELKLSTKYNIGLDAVEVLGSTIVEDRHCPVGHAYQVPEGSFTLGTAGGQPKIDAQDGKRFHYDRVSGKLQFVLAMDGNSYSEAVHTLVHAKLPTRTTNA